MFLWGATLYCDTASPFPPGEGPALVEASPFKTSARLPVSDTVLNRGLSPNGLKKHEFYNKIQKYVKVNSQ